MSAAAFLDAIRADPDDDTPRLVYADWLDDHGDAERAELIRVQCELARWVPDLTRREQLYARQRELIECHQSDWLGPLASFCRSWSFERGLVRCTLTHKQAVGRRFQARAAERMRHALVGGIRIEALDAAAVFPALPDVTDLDLARNGIGDMDLWTMLGGIQQRPLVRLDLSNNHLTDGCLHTLEPLLTHLTWLDLRNNRISAAGVRALLRRAQRGPLRWLDVHGNNVGSSVLHEVGLWREQRGSRMRRMTNSLGMDFVLIPAGTFRMGAPVGEESGHADERPVHDVTLTRPFYLGVYTVTQRQFEEVLKHNPSHYQAVNGGGPDHPVDSVTWEDAVEFCARLSALPEEQAAGRTYRLPTEAEWEYACRAGVTSERFSTGDSLGSTQANFDGNSPGGDAPRGPYLNRTAVVGSYPPNGFGLYDMHGNVWEWCADWYHKGYYAKSPPVDPQGPRSGERRVVRGGSWYSNGDICRTAYRGDGAGVDHLHNGGFRVAFTG